MSKVLKKYKKECLWILVLLVLFLVLTYLVVTLKTSKIDEEAFNLLIRLKCKPVTSILYVITEIGSSIGVIMVLLISLIPFIKTKKLSDFKYVLINTMLGVLLMKGIKEKDLLGSGLKRVDFHIHQDTPYQRFYYMELFF